MPSRNCRCEQCSSYRLVNARPACSSQPCSTATSRARCSGVSQSPPTNGDGSIASVLSALLCTSNAPSELGHHLRRVRASAIASSIRSGLIRSPASIE